MKSNVQHIGVVFTSDWRQSNEIGGLKKQAQFYVRFIALRLQNVSFQRTQFSKRSLFWSSLTFMNLSNDSMNAILNGSDRYGIPDKISRRDTSRQSVPLWNSLKLWMSSYFSEHRSQLRSFSLVSRMPLEKSARKVLVVTRNYIFDLGWCRLAVDPEELLEIAVSREIFRVFLVTLPLRHSSEKNVLW